MEETKKKKKKEVSILNNMFETSKELKTKKLLLDLFLKESNQLDKMEDKFYLNLNGLI